MGTNDASETNPEDRREQAAALIEQGRAMLDQGEIDSAIECFDQATGLDELNAAGWNDLAVALYMTQERQAAIGCLYTAMKVDPTFADAAINLATLLAEDGRPTDGVPGLRSVLFSDPDHADVRDILASLGVATPRKVAIVAIDGDKDVAKVVDACLTEWHTLIVRPDPALVAAYGDAIETTTWSTWLAAVRPDTIIADPEHPATSTLKLAAAEIGVTVATLGEELPDGTPLVDLARALNDGVPPARETWDDIEAPAPAVSVLLQTTHIAHTVNVLDRLATQDLPPGMFEVVIVDRAWGEASTTLLEHTEYDFPITVIRAEGVGLGEARNLAMARSRGNTVLFFDEESRPASDNVRGHLLAQLDTASPTAILGDFRLHPNLIDNSLRRLISTSTVLFAQPGLIHGTTHGGAAFRANNISVPRSEVMAVGGFDPVFTAGCEDTDIGVRLEKSRGVRVQFNQTLSADVDYAYSIGDFQVEQLVRGWACVHLAKKHNEPGFLIDPTLDTLDETWFAERRLQSENDADQARDLAQRVMAVCQAEEPYRKTGAAEILEDIVRVIGMQAFNRGIAIAHAGRTLEEERMPGSLFSTPTPIIVRAGGDLTATLESLAATDGDVIVFTNEPCIAPAGLDVRKGGLQEAIQTGAPAFGWIEAGTVLPPEWRAVMLTELEAWPDFGAVQPAVVPGAENRPILPPVMVVATNALEALGTDPTEAMDSIELSNRLGEVGFQLVALEQLRIERVVQTLEKAG